MSSAWSPLRVPIYRRLWTASLVSNVGTWMQNVAAVWLMTSLTTSATLVALVQSASAAPMLLLAVLAGALADVVDRRRLIVFTQLWSFALVALLGALTLLGWTTPALLLLLTVAVGAGSALYVPASQAINPELVPREDLPAAVALGGVSMNGARALGPALGGALVAATNPGVVFLLNAASFLGVAGAVASWRRETPPPTLPVERVAGALRAGLRYTRHAPLFRAVLARAALFIAPGSALMALLPLVARRQLGLSAIGYGGLLGSIGAGAVLGATLLPRLRRALGRDGTIVAASLGFALASAACGLVALWAPQLGTPQAVALLVPALLVGGVSWIGALATLNTAAQTAVPAWVRGRALGVYLTVFQGGMALASAGWGLLAEQAGAPRALLVAAGAGALGALLGLLRRLGPADPDLSPALRWPEPILALPAPRDAAPVQVTVEYTIDPARAAEFLRAAQQLEPLRRRDGATLWALYQDAERPESFLETFLVESWDEHLRQHARFSQADTTLEDAVRAFQRDGAPPQVRHLLTPSALEPPPAQQGEPGGVSSLEPPPA